MSENKREAVRKILKKLEELERQLHTAAQNSNEPSGDGELEDVLGPTHQHVEARQMAHSSKNTQPAASARPGKPAHLKSVR